MTDLYENPMGLNGFEFVEFASPEPGVLEPLFETLGFIEVAKHRSKEVTLWRQGDINFIINSEPLMQRFLVFDHMLKPLVRHHTDSTQV